ncbi:MAG: hypothetical protein LBL84_01470 [Candidatus Nomurabacteria bacterium]|jgi:hypothetical protein|nr:hypothetical protein [Candidatus Nomurabacteria bacterium]
MKILWMSRHEPLQSQLLELKRLFGEVEVVQETRPFDSAEQIAERYRKGGFDDIVIVCPLSVAARLVDLKIRPLWAVMPQVDSASKAELTMPRKNGRVDYYQFDRFCRVKALQLELEELE